MEDATGRGDAPDGHDPVGKLSPGLYLVATPIGAARDITLRALDVLGAADVLAAEDTRTLRHLMEMHGVGLRGRRVQAYHDHNGAQARPALMRALAAGQSVAYASDAGTPLVADPGYRLVREAAAAGHAVHPVPGASAALAALSVAGLPSDRFLFAGFPPATGAGRARFLDEVAAVPATLILFESGRRAAGLIQDLCALGHGSREAALCREMTKRHEEIRRATLAELSADLSGAAVRGEVVLVIGPPLPVEASEAVIAEALREEMERLPLKQASAEIAKRFGVSKRNVYQIGLGLKTDR